MQVTVELKEGRGGWVGGVREGDTVGKTFPKLYLEP